MRRSALAGLVVALAAVLPSAALAEDNPTPQHIATDSSFLIGMPALTDNPASVCIVDRGVTSNPDLEGALSGRESFVSTTPDDDGSGHGTYVAEVAVAQPNGWGTIGAWPAGRVYSVRALQAGQELFSPSEIARGIVRCVEAKLSLRINVVSISISLGGPGNLDPADEEAITFARRYGIDVVASAGNGAGPTTGLSAAPGVLAIGAGTADGSLCDFAARGPDIDLVALGCGVELGDPADGSVIAGSGSSLAAPFVAAVLAALRDHRPDLGVDAAEALLLNTARRASGGPVLDTAAAFRAAGLGDLVDAFNPLPQSLTVAAPSPVVVPAIGLPTAVDVCRSARADPARWCIAPVLETADWVAPRTLRLVVAKLPAGAQLVARAAGRATRSRLRVISLNLHRGTPRSIRLSFARGARRSLGLTLRSADLPTLARRRSVS